MRRTVFISAVILFISTVFYFTNCSKNNVTNPGHGATMLDGAIKYMGDYPTTSDVSYVDKTGQTITVRTLSGWVSLIVPPITLNQRVANLVHRNNGTIVSQIPKLGLYWVSVTPGTEAMFISVVQDSSYVLNVKPAVPGSLGRIQGTITGPVQDFNMLTADDYKKPLNVPGDIAELDDFTGKAGGSCPAGISHGQFVGAVLTDNASGDPSISVTQYQCNHVAIEPLVFPTDGSSFQLTRIAQAAMEDNTVKVINISQQGIWTANAGNEGNVDRHTCDPIGFRDICNQLAADESAFLEQIYLTVQNMDESAREHLIVTVSAGNSGLDLTGEMNFLKSIAPDAVKHIILVGGTLDDGTPNPGFNSSTNPDDMVFAAGTVTETVGGTTCTDNGTSFASPQVARLAAQAIKQNTDLTASQIVAAIRKAAPLNNATSVMPNGYHSLPPLSMVQAAARQCSYSINPSGASFDSSGGSGTVEVTTGSGCPWTAGVDNVDWISITSGSGPTTGTGTVSYSIQPNTTSDQRTGSIFLGSKEYVITQNGSHPAAASIYTVTVTTTPGTTKSEQDTIADISAFEQQIIAAIQVAMTDGYNSCVTAGCDCSSPPVTSSQSGNTFTITGSVVGKSANNCIGGTVTEVVTITKN